MGYAPSEEYLTNNEFVRSRKKPEAMLPSGIPWHAHPSSVPLALIMRPMMNWKNL
ncbi:MAG TPA: hypothetical protein VFN35_04180 [Ktedonobacteraceae bacterium]|nr:hypothetical protein [Ktedonobacteraceae bacterium]